MRNHSPRYFDGISFIVENEPEISETSVRLMASLFRVEIAAVEEDIANCSKHPYAKYTVNNMYGANVTDLIKIVNHMVRHADWKCTSKLTFNAELEILGIKIKAQQMYHAYAPQYIRISGEKWSVSLSVTKNKPGRLNKDETVKKYMVFLPKELLVLGEVYAREKGAIQHFHGPFLSNPEHYELDFGVDAFQHDISILRLLPFVEEIG